MAKALISIDYTEDFVADHGKLTAGAPAQAISKAIDQVTRLAFERGTISFSPLMPMKRRIHFTQKASSFRHTTSSGLVAATSMVP